MGNPGRGREFGSSVDRRTRRTAKEAKISLEQRVAGMLMPDDGNTGGGLPRVPLTVSEPDHQQIEMVNWLGALASLPESCVGEPQPARASNPPAVMPALAWGHQVTGLFSSRCDRSAVVRVIRGWRFWVGH